VGSNAELSYEVRHINRAYESSMMDSTVERTLQKGVRVGFYPLDSGTDKMS
jgi:hypothetical protein